MDMLRTSQPSLLWLGMSLLGLFVLAIVLELFRRRRARKLQTKAEWDAVTQIGAERELSESQWRCLHDVVSRWAPREPLRAITTRHLFDHCVDSEMARLARAEDWDVYGSVGETLRAVRVQLALDYVPIGQRIHSTRELYLNQPIWVAPVEPGSQQKGGRVKVIDVNEGLFLVEGLDGAREMLGSLKPGDSVSCRMWRKDDARYVFRATLAYRTDDGPPAWAFLHTSGLERLQSRNYYRIPYDQDTSLRVLKLEADEETGVVSATRLLLRLQGRIVNISAGGFAALIHRIIPQETLLEAAIALPGEEGFEVQARTIAVEPLSGGRHLVRAAFVEQDNEREVIARFVLRQQQPQHEPEDDA